MRVIQTLGSNTDSFMFKVSFFYGKNCPLDLLYDPAAPDSDTPAEVRYDYAVYLSPATTLNTSGVKQRTVSEKLLWYFIKGQTVKLLPNKDQKSAIHDLTEDMFLSGSMEPLVRDPNLPDYVIGPLNTGEMIALLEEEQKIQPYSLMVPQCFDYVGMTTVRTLFEDVLKIPHPGPTATCNALGQSKPLTRAVLAQTPGVYLPKGEVLTLPQELSNGFKHQPMPKVSIPLPVVIKPAEEDNSRGVSLCKEASDLEPALRKAFSYGRFVVVEQFIPGREVRAGCVNAKFCSQNATSSDPTDDLHVFGAKINYVMANKNYPIRTLEDKLVESEKKSEGSTAIQLSNNERYYTNSGDPRGMSSEVLAKVDHSIRCAHRAMGYRDYSMFDFRVHDDSGIPYLIEACPFWSFTPVSVLSALTRNSREFSKQEENEKESAWKAIARRMWLNAAAIDRDTR